jgi:hypothetical protein
VEEGREVLMIWKIKESKRSISECFKNLSPEPRHEKIVKSEARKFEEIIAQQRERLGLCQGV